MLRSRDHDWFIPVWDENQASRYCLKFPNQTASLKSSYKQMCSFFWVLHGNAKCQLLCTLPFGQASIQGLRTSISEWNKRIEKTTSFFLREKNTMNSCNLHTCTLDKTTVKLKATIDKKWASTTSTCVKWLCKTQHLL